MTCLKMFPIVAALLSCATGNAFAAKVGSTAYAYGYDEVVKAIQDDDAFVVCAVDRDCDADKLVHLPRQAIVAIKMNDATPVPADADPATLSDLVFGDKQKAVQAGQKCVGKDCLVGSVLFGFDAPILTKSEHAKLEKLADTIPAGASVSVFGYTCDIGPKKHNRNLSEDRAQTVAKVLRARGVHVEVVAGKGECCPVSKSKKLNRRVEISE